MKRFNWTLRNKETGEKVGYSSSFGPVDEDHVRHSPSVKDWAGECKFEVIPETYGAFDSLKG